MNNFSRSWITVNWKAGFPPHNLFSTYKSIVTALVYQLLVYAYNLWISHEIDKGEPSSSLHNQKWWKMITASIFIWAVIAVFFVVAKQPSFNAIAISTSQEIFLAQRFIGEEERLHLFLLGFGITVFDGILPITGLLLNVKSQTGRTTDGLQTLE